MYSRVLIIDEAIYLPTQWEDREYPQKPKGDVMPYYFPHPLDKTTPYGTLPGITTLFILSKSIYEESQPIFYTNNTFTFHQSKHLEPFIEKYGHLITQIRFCIVERDETAHEISHERSEPHCTPSTNIPSTTNSPTSIPTSSTPSTVPSPPSTSRTQRLINEKTTIHSMNEAAAKSLRKVDNLCRLEVVWKFDLARLCIDNKDWQAIINQIYSRNGGYVSFLTSKVTSINFHACPQMLKTEVDSLVGWGLKTHYAVYDEISEAYRIQDESAWPNVVKRTGVVGSRNMAVEFEGKRTVGTAINQPWAVDIVAIPGLIKEVGP
jgi:hypothetical protein